MSRWRRRQIDLKVASEKIAEAERRVRDIAARRARLEADVATYVLQLRKKGV